VSDTDPLVSNFLFLLHVFFSSNRLHFILGEFYPFGESEGDSLITIGSEMMSKKVSPISKFITRNGIYDTLYVSVFL